MSNFDPTPLSSILEEFIPQGRKALLPALHAAQNQFGYLPEPVVARISQALNVPLADIYGVIEFYSMFYHEPMGKTIIRVCQDPACGLAGSDAVLEAVCQHLGVRPDETSSDGAFTVENAPCLGLCEHAPAVLCGERAVSQASPTKIADWLNGGGVQASGIIAGDIRILSANCGRGQTTSLQEYETGGGYTGLKKALSLTPAAIITEIKDSGLVGRGGAAFPTGIKWEGAAHAFGQPKYVICNADESEPGTFKDRVLLEEDPHRVLEGMVIAAFAIGANKGYIYVRGEYPNGYRSLSNAILEAQKAGYIGHNLLESGFDFEIELRQGAGAYICGEETALFESIEGKRGFPRVKPPFPTTHGLFGLPTVINNVETLCNVPYIITHGASVYRQLGTQQSPGSKLFCLSGDIAKPGVYEIPFGLTLRRLVYDLAGGIRDGHNLQAILLGGAAGVFVTPDQLDVQLTFEDLDAVNLLLGSGVVMVFDDTRDLRDVLRRIARFFAHESCGKCYPCQLGTQRQHEILARLADNDPLPGDIQRLQDVGWTMADSSLCGLGQTAATAVLSALNLWPELFEARE